MDNEVDVLVNKLSIQINKQHFVKFIVHCAPYYSDVN